MAIYLTGSFLFPSFLYFLLEAIFIALQKTKYIFVSALCRDASLLIMGASILSMGHGVNAVFKAMFIARMIGVISFLCFSCWQGLRLFSWINGKFSKTIIKLIPAFFLTGVCYSVFLEIDTIILSKILPISELGIYNLGKRIFRIGNVFYFSAVTAFFPMISQAFSMPKNELFLIYKRLMWTIFVLSSSLALLMLVFSGFIVHFFYGDQYLPALRYLKVLIWALVPLSLALLLSRFLMAGHQQIKDLIAVFCGVCCLVLLGIFFSIKWGGMGMAVAFTLSAFVMAAVCYYFNRILLNQLR